MTISIVTCTVLCLFAVCVTAAKKGVEYKRNGACDFTQECVYKYTATQYNYGEEDREVTDFSADVNWHCDSSGTYGTQSASEFCFTISNAVIKASTDFKTNDSMNYTSDDQEQFITDKLQGEFCYVQTSDGKIVSVHYGTTENEEAINIKKSIASTFQANFDGHNVDIEEADAGSLHISHYTFNRTSDGMVIFTRTVATEDLIKMANPIPDNSIILSKREESVFVNKLLESSHGVMRVKVDFAEGNTSMPKDDNDTFYNRMIDFAKQFQSNGTYSIEKVYCKQRHRRNAIFADLAAPNLEKGDLLVVIDFTKYDLHRIKKIRDAIESVTDVLKTLHEDQANSSQELVEHLKELIKLEAQYGPPADDTPALDQLIDYYNTVKSSTKPEDVEIRKLIYILLSIDSSPQAQQILGSLLTENMGEDERDILLHQLAQISNAGPELVDTVININPSNGDDLLLVLGALARNNDHAIQSVVVRELLRRLDTVKSSTNNTELIILLNYALGNTGSKLAIDALLSSLDYDDIDTQISVIRGLGVHLDQPAVQKALMILLNGTEEDTVLDEVLMILKEAYNDKILLSPSEDLLNTIVKTAVKLENPNLYELLIQYLTLVGTDGAQQHINTLQRQHNYGQVVHDQVSNDGRVKRAWDDYNTNWDIVESYSQRRSDVRSYPNHKYSITWGRAHGINNLYLQTAGGAFSGSYCSYYTRRMKLYGKTSIRAYVFGVTYNVAFLQYTDFTSDSNLDRYVYVRLGNTVYINRRWRLSSSCYSGTSSLWSMSRSLFTLRVSAFIYVSTMYFNVAGSVYTTGSVKSCICPYQMTACTRFKPSLYFYVRGGGTATLANTVRGGINVDARFTYYIEPHMCVNCGSTCLQLYHGTYANHVRISPWYQTRTLIYNGWSYQYQWGRTQSWNPVNWSSNSFRSLLWSYCSTRPCTV